MSARTVREQIAGGIAARVDEPIVHAAAAIELGYRTMLGLDGTSLDDAVEAAYTPTGPSREVLRERIAWRRAHPDLVGAPPVVEVAA